MSKLTVLGVYTGKYYTRDEFNGLKTSGSSYHRFVYECTRFKSQAAATVRGGRGRSGGTKPKRIRFGSRRARSALAAPEAFPMVVDATECGSAMREINHFAIVDAGLSDGEEDATVSDLHQQLAEEGEGDGAEDNFDRPIVASGDVDDEDSISANAVFVEVWDSLRNRPCVLVVASADISPNEEVFLDYSAEYFHRWACTFAPPCHRLRYSLLLPTYSATGCVCWKSGTS